jgi:hypothetical protein
MATVHDHRPDVREEQRSPAVRDQGAGDEQRPGLRQQISDGRWQLYALEVLVLLVVFGWMAITNVAAGGHGPL